MANRVVHFEIQADESERVIKFYESVFGWTFQKCGEKPYWMLMMDSTSSPQAAEKDSKELGINGGLLPRPRPAPKPGEGLNAFVCTAVVLNFDETAKKIEAF